VNNGFTSSGTDIPGIFDLSPKIGWEAATGFDYKFTGSPWHVSGQFRYGEGGKTSGTATSAGTLDPSILADPYFGGKCFGFSNYLSGPFGYIGPPSACGGTHTNAASYKETHWLADLALGYDVAGYGPSAVQMKGGLRISEFVAKTSTSESLFTFANYASPVFPFGGGGPSFTSLSSTRVDTSDIRDSFLGAGPLIGLEGSVRFLGAWSFDYKGDLAVLFGTQKSVSIDKTIVTTSPATLMATRSGFCCNSISTDTEARFATMLSADIQAGVSYWFTPNVKLGVSYRIDTLIAVKNTKSANAGNLVLPQRYWDGPRVTLTGQFTPD
jgi:opacity protein-like surface antigen